MSDDILQERARVLTWLFTNTEAQPPPVNEERLTSPCRVMVKYLENTGYGRVKYRGRPWQAHALVYTLWHADRPPIVRHRCDVRACIEPSHLIAGSPKTNMEDKVRRGRCGNTRRKLTIEQVREIKVRLAAGESHRKIAEGYPCTSQMIDYIAKGRSWAKVAV